MNPKFSSSLTSFESESISINLQGDSHVASSKMIVSIVIAVAITSSTLVSPVMTPIPAIKVIREAKDQNINNHSQANPNNMYFSNNENKDDVIKMNNEHLEVEDLADRVTQAQIDEIKDHFDTKLDSLKKDIELMFEKQTSTSLQSKLDIIEEGKKAKKDTIRWFIGTSIALVAAVAAIFAIF